MVIRFRAPTVAWRAHTGYPCLMRRYRSATTVRQDQKRFGRKHGPLSNVVNRRAGMIDFLVTTWFVYHLILGDTADDMSQHWLVRLALWLDPVAARQLKGGGDGG